MVTHFIIVIYLECFQFFTVINSALKRTLYFILYISLREILICGTVGPEVYKVLSFNKYGQILHKISYQITRALAFQVHVHILTILHITKIRPRELSQFQMFLRFF